MRMNREHPGFCMAMELLCLMPRDGAPRRVLCKDLGIAAAGMDAIVQELRAFHDVRMLASTVPGPHRGRVPVLRVDRNHLNRATDMATKYWNRVYTNWTESKE